MLATPRLVALSEETTVAALEGHLDPKAVAEEILATWPFEDEWE